MTVVISHPIVPVGLLLPNSKVPPQTAVSLWINLDRSTAEPIMFPQISALLNSTVREYTPLLLIFLNHDSHYHCLSFPLPHPYLQETSKSHQIILFHICLMISIPFSLPCHNFRSSFQHLLLSYGNRPLQDWFLWLFSFLHSSLSNIVRVILQQCIIKYDSLILRLIIFQWVPVASIKCLRYLAWYTAFSESVASLPFRVILLSLPWPITHAFYIPTTPSFLWFFQCTMSSFIFRILFRLLPLSVISLLYHTFICLTGA